MKSALKRLRSSQPFNYLATTSIRGALNAIGLRSEAVIRHLHRVGNVESALPNGRHLRLWSKADDWVSNQVFWRGWQGYEPETVPLFFRLARRATTTLDIGAYVGFFTLVAAAANDTGQVIAIEPHPEIFRRLESNVALNSLTNVTCIQAASGRSNGVAQFFYVKDGLPTSSSLSFDFMRDAENLDKIEVPLLTVDGLLRERGQGKIDLMKIDTESTEHDVLAGALETLTRDRPAIVCEVLEGRANVDALDEILRSCGYRYYLLTPQGPSHRERIEGHPTMLNYLFSTLSPSEVSHL